MLYDSIVALVGKLPYGFEPVFYCICVIVLVWLLNAFFSILNAFFNMIGGFRNG